MKLRFVVYGLVFVCGTLTPCLAHHTALVVNKQNAAENISSPHLSKIIRGEVKRWPNGNNVILVLHKNSIGEREALEHLTRMSAAEWKSFVALHRESIILVDTDTEVLETVQAKPGAVGLIEVHSINNSVNVIRVDGKLPMELGYMPH